MRGSQTVKVVYLLPGIQKDVLVWLVLAGFGEHGA